MVPRRRQEQPPLTWQVKTEEIQEIVVQEVEVKVEEDLEETMEVAIEVGHVHITTPPWTGRPLKATGAVSGPDSHYAQVTATSRRVKKPWKIAPPYNFSREQEEELVDWYQANTDLYDKNSNYYRSKTKKSALLHSKAKEFPGCTYAQLCRWIKGQRTRYGKLSRSASRSGSGGKKVTDREQWILDKWAFMETHIIRLERRRSTKRFEKKTLPSVSSEDGLDALEVISEPTPSTSQQHSARRWITASPTVGSTTTTAEEEERQATQRELIKELVQQATGAREARHSMIQPQTSHERAVDTFLAFLKTELLKIPENVWNNYTIDALSRAQSFSRPCQPSLMKEET
ncbi:uncharacterized protein LOC116966869 isoform X2 [Amblyraja radiata]|uniref:uncharacterized protein LOC116966869 isoform X2 n=1 Tax=Amblyraja radiata TaxID=386614 RepID=UPI0014023BC6|nr:uncharacterized protein LOC116966869 isoform X2 [Amblyraja radiata]